MARIARWGGLAVVALALLLPAPASAQAFTSEQLSELPQLKSANQAARVIQQAYPARLAENGITGRVQVRFVVNPDGSVDPASVEVVAASVKALGEAAVTAVKKLEFNPGKKDGAAVAAIVLMPITFGAT